MATALSYSRVRYQKLRNLSRFTKILRSQSSKCCQERDSIPDFGSSVLSELSMINPDLDVGKRLGNPIELQKNMQARRLQNISIQKLAIKYGRMMKIKQEKDILDQERKKLNIQIQTMMKEKAENEEIENVKVKARGLREQHDTVEKSLQDMQREVNLMAFGLPNILSTQTPVDNEEVLEVFGEIQQKSDIFSHIEVAEKTDLIKFSSVGDRAFYFTGEAAELQQHLLSYFSTRIADKGFIPMKSPDFFKDFVIEGCGIQTDMTYLMHQPHLDQGIQYCVLGTSEASFAAYLTKMNVSQKSLPLQLMSVGPSYSPVRKSLYPGLFSAAQTSKVNLIGVNSTSEEIYSTFTELQKNLLEMYKQLKIPLRMVLVPAQKLKLSEEIRAELQIWTPSLQEYLSVASLSILGDYISRRLAVRPVGIPEFQASTLHMVYGEVLDTTRLIAVLLEHGSLNKKDGTFHMMKLDIFKQFKKSV